jgi:hypothetical protein
MAITTAGSTPGISLTLTIRKQWNGAFDGEISLTNTGSNALSQWSVSFVSRYALKKVSNFTLQQTQQADGTWLITLRPPSWGTTLLPNRTSSSYVQGALPSGTRLASLSASEVLLAGSSGGGSSIPTPLPTPTPTPTPNPTPNPTPGTGGGTTPSGGGGTATTPLTPLTPGGVNSGNAADALWGERFFAPYVDMGLYPVPDLDGLARQHGVGLFTLAFIQATPAGDAAWAGLQALTLTSTNSQAIAIRNEISQLRAIGGDAMVSFGGAAGLSLAEKLAASGASATELANRYRQVIDSLALNRIDFDIEGAALANRAANQLLADALRLVQQSHPGLEIWFTLPVLPQGLTADGLAVVRQALSAGVKLDGVNLMTMNYGDGAAPPARQSMGQYAIDAANASFRQLGELFGGFGQGFGWNQLGITPMIGVNDIRSEVFSSGDAQLVEDFARSNGVGMLAMWSIARDNPGPLGQVANTHTGTSAASGSYSAIWGDYGTDPVISGGTTGGAMTGGGGTGSPAGSGGGPIGGTAPSTTIAVAAATTALTASATTVERFQLSWAWGRKLTISGFDPLHDAIDLKGFWAEGQQARVVATPGGASVLLDFNAQQVLLPGVDPGALTSAVVQIWQG